MHRIVSQDPAKLIELLDAVLLIDSDLSLPVVLQRVVGAACTLADARYGALGVLDITGQSLAEFITEGLDPAQIDEIGDAPKGLGLLGRIIKDAVPLRVKDLNSEPNSSGFPPNHPKMSSFLGVPIKVGGEVFGNIYLTEKQSAKEFTLEDEQIVIALASAAGIAIANARLNSKVRELTLAEDRARIARDLHDEIIQRIFAVGLSLQSMVRQIDSNQLRGRMEDAIDELDETIKQIRTTIFALSITKGSRQVSPRSQIMAVASDVATTLGYEPRVTFAGPIDAFVQEPVLSNLLAVLRESLSNVAKHAQASIVDVQVTAGEELTLVVRDNGRGLGGMKSQSLGIANMRERAEQLGGTFEIANHEGGGVVAIWSVVL